jgi:hypothetical protein
VAAMPQGQSCHDREVARRVLMPSRGPSLIWAVLERHAIAISDPTFGVN